MINPKNAAEVPLEEVAMFGVSRRQDQASRALPGALQCTWDGYGHRGALKCAAIRYAGRLSSDTVHDRTCELAAHSNGYPGRYCTVCPPERVIVTRRDVWQSCRDAEVRRAVIPKG